MLQPEIPRNSQAVEAFRRNFTSRTLIRLLKRHKTALVIVAVGAILISLYSTWRYGSLRAAALAFQGYALEVTPARVALGSVVAMEATPVRFAIRNLNSLPVTLLGFRAGCRCTIVEGLPVTIQPGLAAELTAIVRTTTNQVGKPTQSEILLYSDADGPPAMFVIAVTTTVAKEAVNEGVY